MDEFEWASARHLHKADPVKIFVRRIPRTATPSELRRFAELVLAPRWYRPFDVKGSVKSCVILKIRDLESGTIEFHGLLEVQPVKAAQSVIRKLNRTRFKNQLVEVRKWQLRSELNDQRRHRDHPEPHLIDQRRGDRRRSNLVMDTYTPVQVQAVKGFQREYGL